MNYKTTDTKTGKEQWFEVSYKKPSRPCLNDMFSYSDNAHIYPVAKVLEQLQEIHYTDLKAEPITCSGADTVIKSRLQSRGYENDTEPFVIRGKRIGEFSASIWSRESKELSFMSIGYETHLTDCQKMELQTRFGKELYAILFNPSTLAQVQKEERADILKNIGKNIPMMRKQLEQIEEFIVEES